MKIQVRVLIGCSIDMENFSTHSAAVTNRIILLAVAVILLLSCQSEEQYPNCIIEIVDVEHSLSKDDIERVIKESGIISSSLYNWENHWVIYSNSFKYKILKENIENELSNVKVSIFDQPFYTFRADKNCNKKPVPEWENIIMTANLVDDETFQNEYMEYHKVQFEEWPEVSAGFCNADFQQLLLFRNGRQLMLVISIPKGKSLDELNPKTTENNPRVDEWNSIMVKFQEGIEDAPDDVVWVEFLKVQ